MVSTLSLAANVELQFVEIQSLASQFKIEKKLVGGLSGCAVYKDKIYFVSDDRGEVSGSRFLVFPINLKTFNIDFAKGKNVLIKKESDQRILDLEGIGLLSESEILLSSEGDLNKKPRVMPQIFLVDSHGKRTQLVELPSEFLPERTGQQTKGVQNNLAFEGLNVDLGLKKWAAMLEAPLLQDVNQGVGHLLMIEGSTESKPLRVEKQWSYPVPTAADPQSLQAYLGVTDIVYKNENELLVLERGVEISLAGLAFQTQICLAEKQKDGKNLSRQCFYSFNQDEKLKKELPHGANLEGLCWLNSEKTDLLVVSDNNFSSKDKTFFLRYKVKNK